MAQYRSSRKKWATRHHPGSRRRQHTSKLAAYRYVRGLAAEYNAGLVRPDLDRVGVWVDEGRGWELYETVRLADVVPSQGGEAAREAPPKDPDLRGES